MTFVLAFSKYHGLGNDFIVVDRKNGGEPLAPAAVRALCDRHRGVGADGVLTLWPAARGSRACGRMQTQNADGSEAEVCGNGLRCLARYAFDARLVAPGATDLTITAGERDYHAVRLTDDRFRVHMGGYALAHRDLSPRATTANQGRVELEAEGRRFVATCVHLGNPHAVIFVDDGDDGDDGDVHAALRTLALRYGPALERHPDFAARVNVSFVRSEAGGFVAAVYERGAGLTLACGSGACAIGAAAVQRGLAARGAALRIELPGGTLRVSIDAGDEIELEGEAVRVFTGEAMLS